MTSSTQDTNLQQVKIPELTFYGPDCPLCLSELNYEEGWDCSECGLWWDDKGQFVARLDDSVPQCLTKNPVDDSCFCIRDRRHSQLHIGVSLAGIVSSWSST